MISVVRNLVKKVIPKRWISFSKNLMSMERLDIIENNILSLLQLAHKSVIDSLDQRMVFRSREFKVHSKFGEDGILLYIFSKIGTTNRCFVEFGVEDGRECNTANLSLNFGWNGLIMDARKDQIVKAKHYYQERLGKRYSSVKIVQCFVTAENINKVLLDNNISGNIDLLSIDIDGNDYWVWRAIKAISPRVVVMEYNASLGSNKSIVVKYDPNFDVRKKHAFYHGASLTALTKLADSKGYALIGCESNGIDAFFVRKDAARGKLDRLSPQECFYPHSYRLKHTGSTEEQFEQIKNFDFDVV